MIDLTERVQQTYGERKPPIIKIETIQLHVGTVVIFSSNWHLRPSSILSHPTAAQNHTRKFIKRWRGLSISHRSLHSIGCFALLLYQEDHRRNARLRTRRFRRYRNGADFDNPYSLQNPVAVSAVSIPDTREKSHVAVSFRNECDAYCSWIIFVRNSKRQVRNWEPKAPGGIVDDSLNPCNCYSCFIAALRELLEWQS